MGLGVPILEHLRVAVNLKYLDYEAVSVKCQVLRESPPHLLETERSATLLAETLSDPLDYEEPFLKIDI